MGSTNSNFIPASQGLNLGSSVQRWNTFFQNQDVAGASTVTSEDVGTLTADRIAGVRYADQFGSIAAAFADLGGHGTVVAPAGYVENITSPIILAGQRLVIDPGATITFSGGGLINVSSFGYLDAGGSNLTTTSISGVVLQISSGWARAEVAQIIGPSLGGTGTGVYFAGASYSNVSVRAINGFGDCGVKFDCVNMGAAICDCNFVQVGHIFGNTTGILFTNRHSAADSECQANTVICGGVNSNSGTQVQFGDSGTFNAPAGSAQGNRVFTFADAGSGNVNPPIMFLNCSYNEYHGQAAGVSAPAGFICTNAFNNIIVSTSASLTDISTYTSQVWISPAAYNSPGGIILANANPLYSMNNAAVRQSLLYMDGTNVVVLFGEPVKRQIAFQATPGINAMLLDGASLGMQLFGGITRYLGIPTVNGGIPSEIAAADLIAQTAAITTAPLYAVPVGKAGQYRLTWNAKITTAATTGAATSTLGPLTIVYTDPDGIAITLTAAAIISAGTVATSSTANTTSTVLVGIPQILNCKASTAITYAFAYASNTAAQMTFNLHLALESM